MTSRAAVAGLAWLFVVVPAGGSQDWEQEEARAVRAGYPAIQHLPDFPRIKEAFEKGLLGDPSVSPVLAALVKHASEDVASTAAQMLGRFPSAAASTALKDAYKTGERALVRANALAGLARMRDPATAPLSIAALEGDDDAMQGAALAALELLGDNAYSRVILEFYERHPGHISPDGLKSLGELGDPPGSTAVRDKLLAEANNKRRKFAFRYGAALGLETMGLADLVKPILDIQRARDTNSNLIVVKHAMERLAAENSVAVNAQSTVDALLRDVDVSEQEKRDLWGRPLHAKLVSRGVFHVVSDGPDMTRETRDDLSTGEDLDAYLGRVFPDQFSAP
jgi:hypothetical protein